MFRRNSFSRVLSFLLSLVLLLTLAEPAAHAEGLPRDEYIPVSEAITDDTPADDSEFNRWVVPGAEDEELYDFGSGDSFALSPEVIAQDIALMEAGVLNATNTSCSSTLKPTRNSA